MKTINRYKMPVDKPIKDVEWLDRKDVAEMVDEELGIGIYKSGIVYSLLAKVFEQAIRTGKAIKIGNSISLEPVLVTDAVGGVPHNSNVLQVFPEHIEYRLRLSNTLRKEIEGDAKPYYVLIGTNVKIPAWKVHKLDNVNMTVRRNRKFGNKKEQEALIPNNNTGDNNG